MKKITKILLIIILFGLSSFVSAEDNGFQNLANDLVKEVLSKVKGKKVVSLGLVSVNPNRTDVFSNTVANIFNTKLKEASLSFPEEKELTDAKNKLGINKYNGFINAELAKEIAGRTDLPADVKATFEAFNKDLAAFAPKFAAAPAFGRGGGGAAPAAPAAPPVVNLVTRIGQAKNGLMATMPVTEQITKAYAESKAQVPKAILDANALFARASALSTALAPYKLTLTAPQLVR